MLSKIKFYKCIYKLKSSPKKPDFAEVVPIVHFFVPIVSDNKQQTKASSICVIYKIKI